jgi:glycosyltransferase involved in cell wall biosynthesis
MSRLKRHVIVNAIHTNGGGGMTYLNGILKGLAEDNRFRVTLVCRSQYRSRIEAPSDIVVRTPDIPKNFFLLHLWEQFIFPILIRGWNGDVTLCNANYVPLLAPRPIPMVMNNPHVGRFSRSPLVKLYWWTLVQMTRFSILRSRRAIIIARNVIPIYARGPWKKLKRKLKVAYPGAPKIAAGAFTRREAATLMAVGDLYIQKDYMTLLRAFKRVVNKIPAAKLVLVGRALDQKVAAEVENFITEHGLRGSVERKQFLPHDQLLSELRQCTVYVNTSLVECFNLPVVEALAVGAPTLVGDFEFQREVAGRAAHYVGGGTPAERVENYYQAIVTLLENVDLRQQLSIAGPKQIQQFDYKKAVAVIADVIERA